MSGGAEVAPPPLARRRRPWSRALLALVTLLLATAAVELGLRLLPHRWFLEPAQLLEYERSAAAADGIMQADAALGHAPVLGGAHYDQHGLLRAPPASGRRVLFLGDSVTRRGRVVRALAALQPGIACLNAGVEAWNTDQEVEFYLRVNHRARPDQVVLSFHNNDFTVTPVALQTEAGFTLCAPGAFAAFDPALYRGSCLYRLFVHARSDGVAAQVARAGSVASTTASLRRLRDELAAAGTDLCVLLLPILLPQDQWTADELGSRRQAIAIFTELSLRWIDLLPPVERLCRDGFDVQERADDRWHPGDLAALAMASHALQEGVFPDAPRGARGDTVAPAGGCAQRLDLDLGPALGGRAFRVLGSRSGTAPGVDVDGVHLPLNPDAYSVTTFWRPDEVMAGGAGVLDAQGRAVVAVRGSDGPGDAPGGLPLHHAAVVLDAHGVRIERVTNVVPLVRSAPARPAAQGSR